jgi:hypothetical protein
MVALAAGFAASGLLQATNAAEPPAPSAESVQRMHEQLDALQQRVARAERRRDPVTVAEPDEQLPTEEPVAAAPAEEPENHEHAASVPQRALSALEYQQMLASALEHAEVVDAAWQREAEHHFQSGIAAVLPAGSLLRSARCRGWLCRFETSHSTARDHQAFTAEFLDRLTGQAGTDQTYSAVVSKSDHEVIAVAFVARRGFDLPAAVAEERP